jgi:hypothetical protein
VIGRFAQVELTGLIVISPTPSRAGRALDPGTKPIALDQDVLNNGTSDLRRLRLRLGCHSHENRHARQTVAAVATVTDSIAMSFSIAIPR